MTLVLNDCKEKTYIKLGDLQSDRLWEKAQVATLRMTLSSILDPMGLIALRTVWHIICYFLGTHKIIGIHVVICFKWKMSFIMFLRNMSILTIKLWNLLFETDYPYQTICQSSFYDIYLILELNHVFKTVYTIHVATHWAISRLSCLPFPGVRRT